MVNPSSQKKGFSKEEELLLQDFSKNVSTKSSALFYGNALIVSAVPIWLFWRLHQMDVVSSSPLFALVTLVSTWLVAFAYRNTKHLLRDKIAVKREAAVAKVRQEINLISKSLFQNLTTKTY